MNKPFGLIVAATVLSIASPASAAYTISFQESGGKVISTGNGSINLGALTSLGGSLSIHAQMNPGLPGVFVGSSPTAGTYNGVFSGATGGPSSFGTNFFNFLADLFSGPFVGINGSNGFIYLPNNYVSGSDLGISTGTYNYPTFASLGLTPGTYNYMFGQGEAADSFTIRVADVAAPVPEPATWAMMLLGFAGIGFAMRRRRVMALQVA